MNEFEEAFAGLGEIYKEDGLYSHLSKDLLDDNEPMYSMDPGGSPKYSKAHIDCKIEEFIDGERPVLEQPFELGGAL